MAVKGLNELLKKLNQIPKQDWGEILEKGAQVIVNHALELVPVDTGFLRDSIHTSYEAEKAFVNADADYAAYVEHGTYKMNAQPYIRPSMDENGPEICAAVAAELKLRLEKICQ